MALTITHPFVATKSDSADTSIVRKTEWNATHSLSGVLGITNGGSGQAEGFPGYLFGLGLSKSANNVIDVAIGRAAADTTPYHIMVNTTAGLSKDVSVAWAVGDGNGGLDTGAVANTLYYMYLIMRSDTGVVDALMSTSATSPTMPANYDFKRRIGAFYRSAGIIRAFTQAGDFFYFTTPLDDSNPTVGTSRSTITVTVPPNMRGLFRIAAQGASGTTLSQVVLQPIFETDATPGVSATPGDSLFVSANTNDGGAGEFIIEVSASSTIAARSDAAGTTLTVVTRGWIDTRGRDS